MEEYFEWIVQYIITIYEDGSVLLGARATLTKPI